MIIYSQGNSYTCQQFALFGVVGHNFGKYLPQKNVDAWIARNNLKNPAKKGGLSSIQVAEYIAKQIGKKVVTFGFRDAEFMKHWNNGKAICVSLRAAASFYIDCVDGTIDSYKHIRGDNSHAEYMFKNDDHGLLVNSIGPKYPPVKFDLEKFQKNLLMNSLCFTII